MTLKENITFLNFCYFESYSYRQFFFFFFFFLQFLNLNFLKNIFFSHSILIINANILVLHFFISF